MQLLATCQPYASELKATWERQEKLLCDVVIAAIAIASVNFVTARLTHAPECRSALQRRSSFAASCCFSGARARCALPERIRPPKMRFGCATRRAIASDFSSGQRRRRPLLPLKDLHPVAAVAAFLNREISLSACDAHFESASHPF